MKTICFSTFIALTFALTGTTPRTAFADGNVLAYFETNEHGLQTALVVLGDSKDNNVRVTLDDASHVVVDGLNGTTINGLASDELMHSGSNGIPIVYIDLGNGDDTLKYFLTGESSHHTDIVSGSGHDSVSICEFARTGSINVDTGIGDDEVSLFFAFDVYTAGYYEITTGLGTDSVIVEADNSSDVLPFLAGGYVDTGDGDDTVLLKGQYYSFYGDNIQMRRGNDLLIGDPDVDWIPYRDISAHGGTGDDTVLNPDFFGTGSLTLYSFEVIE